MKLVYMAHPVRGDVDRNLCLAWAWYLSLRRTYGLTHWITCPWLLEMLQGADDSDERQRAEALWRCCKYVEVCDEIWLVGHTGTPGMWQEAVHGAKYGVKIVNLTGPMWAQRFGVAA